MLLSGSLLSYATMILRWSDIYDICLTFIAVYTLLQKKRCGGGQEKQFSMQTSGCSLLLVLPFDVMLFHANYV